MYMAVVIMVQRTSFNLYCNRILIRSEKQQSDIQVKIGFNLYCNRILIRSDVKDGTIPASKFQSLL